MSGDEWMGLGYISVPALLQYLRSAESCGLARERLLRECGVSADMLVDNNGRLPGETLQRLLDYVLPRCANPLYGLYTAQFIQPGSYSIMGYIAMTSSTLSEVIARMMQYEKLVGDMGTSRVDPQPGGLLVSWNCRFRDARTRRHIIENVLASWLSYTRWIADEPERSPLAVRFEHAAPEDRSLLRHYQQIFRCPIEFEAECSGLLLSPALYHLRLRQPDILLRDTLENHAQQMLRNIKDDYRLSDQVRNLLRSMIADQAPRKEFIAQQLGLNVRTLHRKLSEEGSSYQKILDTLRHELALKYLSEESWSIEDIGRRLGFSESRSFIRHFKALQGATPGEFRLRRRQDGTISAADD